MGGCSLTHKLQIDATASDAIYNDAMLHGFINGDDIS